MLPGRVGVKWPFASWNSNAGHGLSTKMDVFQDLVLSPFPALCLSLCPLPLTHLISVSLPFSDSPPPFCLSYPLCLLHLFTLLPCIPLSLPFSAGFVSSLNWGNATDCIVLNHWWRWITFQRTCFAPACTLGHINDNLKIRHEARLEKDARG